MKLEHKLYVQKLGKSLQLLNSIIPKNIKRRFFRREQKIAKLEATNKQILIKLNETFLHEEKLKVKVKNTSSGKVEYEEEIDNLNKHK